MRKQFLTISAAAMLCLSLSACNTDPATGQPVLSPVGKTIVKVACTIDSQIPAAVSAGSAIAVIADPSDAAAVAAIDKVDQLAHPAAVGACAAALPGSVPTAVTVQTQ